MRIEVAYCAGPGQDDRLSLDLPEGATVADALRASGVIERHALDPATLETGIWCRKASLAAPLRDRDRVEVYRALQCDPKVARRERYRQRKERAG